MTEPIHDNIRRSVQAAEDLYYRLVLVVATAGSGKTRVLHDLAGHFRTSVINVNLMLSRALLDLTAKQRSRQLPALFNQITDTPHPPVIVDNLELLFDRDLRQDPLRLLQGISRNRTVVASWNGLLVGGRLLYAALGHPEYRSYDAADVLIVDMNRTTTVDSVQPTQ